MELEKKPEDLPDILREEIQGELAKPGAEPYHDELAQALELADASEHLPEHVAVAGSVVPTSVLLDWIDDLRDPGRTADEVAPEAEEKAGINADFKADSAIALGIEVPDARNDDDYFFSAARKRHVEEEEEEGEDGGGGGGGGGGVPGEGDDKSKKPAAAATPPSAPQSGPKKPPTKPAAVPPPKVKE